MNLKGLVIATSIAAGAFGNTAAYGYYSPWYASVGIVGNTTGEDMGHAVAYDKNGSFYYAGMIAGSNIDVDINSPGTDYRSTSGNSSDALLTKYWSSGQYAWSRVIGSTGKDRASSLVTDNNGNVYMMGNFTGTVNFNHGGSDFKTSGNSGTAYDIFVTKINADGSYGWTKKIGGETWTYGRTIAVDSTGAVYVTGHFMGTRDLTPEGTVRTNRTSAGWEDIFLMKINADGSYNYNYIYTMGSTGSDMGHSVAVDASNNVYFTGMFQYTVDLNPTSTVTNYTSTSGSIDLWLMKFNSAGTYQWTKPWGGSGWDAVYSVQTDAAKNIYLGGLFSSTADLDPGSTVQNKTAIGTNDLYVTKLNSSGTWLWSKAQGAAGLDYKFYGDGGMAMNVDTLGNVFVGACYKGTMDFNPDAGTDSKTSIGGYDAYVSRFTTGGAYVWTQITASTAGDDCVHAIATNTIENVAGSPTRDIMTAGTYNRDLTVAFFVDTTTRSFVSQADALGRYVLADAFCYDDTSNRRWGVAKGKATWSPTYTGTKPNGYFRTVVAPWLYDSVTATWTAKPTIDSGWKYNAVASANAPAYTTGGNTWIGTYAYGYRRENGVDTLYASPWSYACQ